jgi:hypothetical protein
MAVSLSIFEIFQGLFSLIFVLVAVIISFFIIRRYFQYDSLEHLYVGLGFLGLAGPWFPDAIVFLSILIGNLANTPFVLEDYTNITIMISLIMTFYTPFALIFWFTAFSKLLRLKYRKQILFIFIAINFLFEILFLIFLFIDLSFLGVYQGPFTYQWGIITTIFYLFSIFVALTTGSLFGYNGMKSEAKENKLKGKFLLISFAFFAVGSLIPYFWFDIVGLVLSRIFLVICVLAFYVGLNMPQFVRDLVLK